MDASAKPVIDPQQRRRVRRSAWLLGGIVLAVYFGFILYSILHARS